MTEQKIVIVGGGFGGVRAALDLAKAKPRAKIMLISDLPHFEYHAALYRVVTGRTPLEVCVPLAEIFNNLPVEIVRDRINRVDLGGKLLTGQSGSRYAFDYLVLAIGSETNYFGIGGLPEFSFGIKSISEALRLKAHLHQIFALAAQNQVGDKTLAGDDQVTCSHIVIVGGGATGVELAGELAVYARHLAAEHGLDPALVTIDLIEGAPRLLPVLPAPVSARVRRHLHHLGVNIFLNRTMLKEELSAVHVGDMTIHSHTVVWTAGVKNNTLLAGVPGFAFDKKGKVLVDGHLRPVRAAGGDLLCPNVFVVGDSVAVQYTGMAPTAVSTGAFAAQAILALMRGQRLSKVYDPQVPFSSIPVGPGWAATMVGSWPVYGRLGWWLRRWADYRYFRSILPLARAWQAFDPEQRLSESCLVCNPAGQLEFK